MALTKNEIDILLRLKDQASGQMSHATGKMGASLGSLVKRLAVAGASYFSFRQAFRSTADIIKTGQDFENLSIVLQEATGDAAAEMVFLRGEVDRLRLDLFASADGYAKLTAASRGTELQGQKTRDIFSGIATAARAMNLSSEQTRGALRAVEQMISKGNVQAEELRGQLGERLPGAFNLAADAMGVTTVELNKMLDTGQVIAADLLPKLAVVLQERFAKGALEAAKSGSALGTAFSTMILDIKKTLAEAGTFDLFKKNITGLIAKGQKLLADGSLTRWGENLSSILGGVVSTVGSVIEKIAAMGGAIAEFSAAAAAFSSGSIAQLREQFSLLMEDIGSLAGLITDMASVAIPAMTGGLDSMQLGLVLAGTAVGSLSDIIRGLRFAMDAVALGFLSAADLIMAAFENLAGAAGKLAKHVGMDGLGDSLTASSQALAMMRENMEKSRQSVISHMDAIAADAAAVKNGTKQINSNSSALAENSKKQIEYTKALVDSVLANHKAAQAAWEWERALKENNLTGDGFVSVTHSSISSLKKAKTSLDDAGKAQRMLTTATRNTAGEVVDSLQPIASMTDAMNGLAEASGAAARGVGSVGSEGKALSGSIAGSLPDLRERLREAIAGGGAEGGREAIAEMERNLANAARAAMETSVVNPFIKQINDQTLAIMRDALAKIREEFRAAAGLRTQANPGGAAPRQSGLAHNLMPGGGGFGVPAQAAGGISGPVIGALELHQNADPRAILKVAADEITNRRGDLYYALQRAGFVPSAVRVA